MSAIDYATQKILALVQVLALALEDTRTSGNNHPISVTAHLLAPRSQPNKQGWFDATGTRGG